MTQKEIELTWSNAKAEHTEKKNAEIQRYNQELDELNANEERIRTEYATKRAALRSQAEALTLTRHALQRDGYTEYSTKSDEALTQLMEVYAAQRTAKDEFMSLLRESKRRKDAAKVAHEEILRNFKIALTKRKNALWAQLEKSENPTNPDEKC